jgi:hypothetical protein
VNETVVDRLEEERQHGGYYDHSIAEVVDVVRVFLGAQHISFYCGICSAVNTREEMARSKLTRRTQFQDQRVLDPTFKRIYYPCIDQGDHTVSRFVDPEHSSVDNLISGRGASAITRRMTASGRRTCYRIDVLAWNAARHRARRDSSRMNRGQSPYTPSGT